jgi:hypothetical protein
MKTLDSHPNPKSLNRESQPQPEFLPVRAPIRVDSRSSVVSPELFQLSAIHALAFGLSRRIHMRRANRYIFGRFCRLNFRAERRTPEAESTEVVQCAEGEFNSSNFFFHSAAFSCWPVA